MGVDPAYRDEPGAWVVARRHPDAVARRWLADTRFPVVVADLADPDPAALNSPAVLFWFALRRAAGATPLGQVRHPRRRGREPDLNRPGERGSRRHRRCVQVRDVRVWL